MGRVPTPPDLRATVQAAMHNSASRSEGFRRVLTWAALAACVAIVGLTARWAWKARTPEAGFGTRIEAAVAAMRGEFERIPAVQKSADSISPTVAAPDILAYARGKFGDVPRAFRVAAEKLEPAGMTTSGVGTADRAPQWASGSLLFRDSGSTAWGILLVQADDGTSGLFPNGTVVLSPEGLPERSVAAWKDGDWAVYLFASDPVLMRRARAALGAPRSFIGIDGYN